MKALVGVDGSSNSFAAVEFMGRLLSPDHDELVLLYAAPEVSIADDERLDTTVLDRARNSVSKAILDEAMRRVPSALHSRLSTPAPIEAGQTAATALLEAIDSHEIDLIAVGFHGTSGIVEEFVLGSVSRTVVHSAKVPVLVVKNAAASDSPVKQSPGPVTKHLHVLTAIDGSTLEEPTAKLLTNFTWPPETRGWAMTVVRPMFVTDLPDWIRMERDPDVAAMASAWELEHQQGLQAARSDLEALGKQLPSCFTNEELIVAEGRAAEEILAQVREKSIDLVVMGRRKNGKLKRLLLGSTSEQVLREAPCSVLIVR